MKTGLHDLITFKRQQLTRDRAIVLDQNASPQAAHDAGVRVEELERDLVPLCRDAETGEANAKQLAAMIDELRAGAATHDLRLCITHLEDAETRLRKHLGANPHE